MVLMLREVCVVLTLSKRVVCCVNVKRGWMLMLRKGG